MSLACASLGCSLRCLLLAVLILALIGVSPAGAAPIVGPLALASSSRPASALPLNRSNSVVTTATAEVCAQPFTPVYQIQGSGGTAAITGKVTTQGVVVGDYELPGGTSQIRGFYLQDPAGDGDPATSDGIFVFDNGVDKV